MSKPIILTDKIIAEMASEFADSIRNKKIADGSITYTKKFTYENDKPITIWFSPVAYTKMIVLIQHFSTEVAWHGVVDRVDGGFVISDILVYPQEVSGTTVNTDQERYQKWLMELDDDIANKLLMQGHSHVTMSTSPSTVDTNHQEMIINQLGGENYYIFMIWNKRMERTIKVYDLSNNTLYEDSDVTINIADVECDFDAFAKDADDLVKTKTYTQAASNTSYYGSGNYKTAYQSETKTSGYNNGKQKKEKGEKGPYLAQAAHYVDHDLDEQTWNSSWYGRT